uniref:Uncharacterized protein n=1 Tax=Rhizophora mucronata TaxID=61149 RepID=A0A2P2QLW8_RHIMU
MVYSLNQTARLDSHSNLHLFHVFLSHQTEPNNINSSSFI